MNRGAWQTPVHGVAKSLITTAVAKSRQSCPTLCDPIDGSPSGSHPWDSQGKNMEWVAIVFSSA